MGLQESVTRLEELRVASEERARGYLEVAKKAGEIIERCRQLLDEVRVLRELMEKHGTSDGLNLNEAVAGLESQLAQELTSLTGLSVPQHESESSPEPKSPKPVRSPKPESPKPKLPPKPEPSKPESSKPEPTKPEDDLAKLYHEARIAVLAVRACEALRHHHLEERRSSGRPADDGSSLSPIARKEMAFIARKLLIENPAAFSALAYEYRLEEEAVQKWMDEYLPWRFAKTNRESANITDVRHASAAALSFEVTDYTPDELIGQALTLLPILQEEAVLRREAAGSKAHTDSEVQGSLKIVWLALKKSEEGRERFYQRFSVTEAVIEKWTHPGQVPAALCPSALKDMRMELRIKKGSDDNAAESFQPPPHSAGAFLTTAIKGAPPAPEGMNLSEWLTSEKDRFGNDFGMDFVGHLVSFSFPKAFRGRRYKVETLEHVQKGLIVLNSLRARNDGSYERFLTHCGLPDNIAAAWEADVKGGNWDRVRQVSATIIQLFRVPVVSGFRKFDKKQKELIMEINEILSAGPRNAAEQFLKDLNVDPDIFKKWKTQD